VKTYSQLKQITMKKIIIISLIFAAFVSFSSQAQNANYSEKYGSTLNLGLGIGGYSGYYGHVGHTLPVFHINYEFDVARNFTLAPFATFYSYRNEPDHYRETVIPIGAKGSLYLDRVLNANSQWDFYLAGSLGFALVNSSWDAGYSGETYYQNVSPLFLDLHIGTECHLSNHVGLFLDLSTGVSTLGLAFH
jgi:hypothetical protein